MPDAGNSADASVEIDVPPTSDVTTATVPIEQRRENAARMVGAALMLLLAIWAIRLVAVAVSLVRPFNTQAVSLLLRAYSALLSA